MNPLKVLKDTLPQLAEVLESIHAHLEKQLEAQEKIVELLQQINQKIK